MQFYDNRLHYFGRDTTKMGYSYFGYFKSKKSKQEILDELRLNINRSILINWITDCYIGKIRKNSFTLYYHSAYMRNSFNKKAYGFIRQDGDKTKIFYIFLSPFLNPITYILITIISMLIFINKIDTPSYIHDVISLTKAISIFPFFIGLISQIIPSPDKKQKIDILLERITKIEVGQVNGSLKKGIEEQL